MRILRFFLTFAIILLVLAGLVAAAVFSPIVQTWYVQRQLDRQPNLKASVESVWAGLSSVQVTNLRLERDGSVLTIPQLDADLPMKTALVGRQLRVRKLVAKGWTLDLNPPTPQPSSATDEAGSSSTAKTAAQSAPSPAAVHHAFEGILSQLQLPGGSSFEDVELEGTVVFKAPSQADPVRVHLVLIGHGVSAGHTAQFTLDASGTAANSNVRWQTTVAHGSLAVDVSPASAITRVGYSGTISSEDESLPKDFTLSGAIVALDANKPETYVVDLMRGDRRVASVAANFIAEEHRFAGDWHLDVHAAEIPTFLPNTKLPALTATGSGEFSADASLTDVRLRGRLSGAVGHWEALSQRLESIGSTTYSADFEAVHREHTLRIARASLSLAAEKPIVRVQALQPFSIDETTGEPTPASRDTPWLEGNLTTFPAAWLPLLSASAHLKDGEVNGAFTVRATEKGVVIESQGPLTANNVTLIAGDRGLGRALDMTAPVRAEFTKGKGWEIQTTPLTITSAGRRLVTLTATLHPVAEPYRFASVSGTLLADLDACSTQPGMATLPVAHGKSVSATFTANLGLAADVTATVNVAGHAPGRSVAATINATIDDLSAASFQVPLKITADGKTSDLSLEGKWTRRDEAQEVDLSVEAHTALFDHLRWISSRVPLLHAATTPVTSSKANRPFWGELEGRLRFEFHVLDMGSYDLHEVAGTFGLQPDELRLNGGRASFNPINTAKRDNSAATDFALESSSAFTAEGSLKFDPTAPQPYALVAHGGVDGLDAQRLFGKPSEGHVPVLDGRWAVAVDVTSRGRDVPELVTRREETFHLTSHAGTLRLLKTNVADALPDAPTPVSDSLAAVGSGVGWLFGVKKDALNRENHLSKGTESILNFTYQLREIACDQMEIDAVRHADDVIDLTRVFIHSEKERLTGTGRIAAMKDTRLRDRPLNLMLQLAVRGPAAEQLASTPLLAPAKDADGYVAFRDTLQFGGTLDQIDRSRWHDLLARAAVDAAKPVARSK